MGISFFTIHSSKSNSSPISQMRIILIELKDAKDMVSSIHIYEIIIESARETDNED